MTYKVKLENVYKLYSTENKRSDQLLEFLSLKKKKKRDAVCGIKRDILYC